VLRGTEHGWSFQLPGSGGSAEPPGSDHDQGLSQRHGRTFYAQYILSLHPESVLIVPISVQIVLVSMLGGAGSIMGPVIGAAILIPISELTRVWLGYKGTGIDMIIYGTLIMLISVYQPKGVWGLLSTIGRRKA
jgi:branched-chain amino acid transport system permease protein